MYCFKVYAHLQHVLKEYFFQTAFWFLLHYYFISTLQKTSFASKVFQVTLFQCWIPFELKLASVLNFAMLFQSTKKLNLLECRLWSQACRSEVSLYLFCLGAWTVRFPINILPVNRTLWESKTVFKINQPMHRSLSFPRVMMMKNLWVTYIAHSVTITCQSGAVYSLATVSEYCLSKLDIIFVIDNTLFVISFLFHDVSLFYLAGNSCYYYVFF